MGSESPTSYQQEQFSTNNQKATEYNAQTGTLQYNFNFMQLKKTKMCSERRAAETVTEEKFTLLIRWYFSIAGGGMNVPVQVVCICSTIVQQLINMS